jgi:hypothetical protein
VHAGRLDRLPAELRTGDLSSIDRISAVYRGRLDACGQVGGRGSRTAFPVEARVADVYYSGLTVHLIDAGPSFPATDPWLRRLEAEVGMPANTLELEVFATPGRGGGAGAHFDATDNIIIQLRGTKRIRVAPSGVRFPVSSLHPNVDLSAEQVAQCGARTPVVPARLTTVQLRPGSAIFVPAGHWHATEHPGDSLSVSLVFKWPRPIDVALASLRAELVRSPEWRAPLYGGWGTRGARTAAARRLARLLGTLPRAAGALSAPEAMRQVADLAAGFKYLDERARFFRVASMRMSFARESRARGAPTVLTIHALESYDRTVIELDEAYVAPCRWIARADETVTVGDFLAAFAGRMTIDRAREILSQLTAAAAIQPVA